MNEQRRFLLNAGVTLGAAALVPGSAMADEAGLDPIPQLPTNPTPGKPGDFDFLAGEWRIRHRQLPHGATE